MKQNRYKKLIYNSGLFFVASFGSKFLSFLLVRFYTEMLSPADYGIIDIITTTNNLCYGMFTLAMADAIIRFAIDLPEEQNQILSIGLKIAMVGSSFLILLSPLLKQIQGFDGYIIFFLLIYLFNSFYALIATFARAINKVKIFAIAGILNTAVHIVGNIVFLVVFDMGIRGYLLASVCASFISAAYVFISIRIDKRIVFKTSKTLSVQMLKYSLPLIPTSISLWVMNSIDRYFIVYMLNVGENGLYTVANHIPSAISMLIALFLQAWQLSTFEEAKSQDRNSYVSEVFSYFTMMLVFCVSITIIFIKPICNILIAPEYLECIYCIPILLLSTIFSSLGSYVGTNYTTEKRTVGIFVTTIIGAVLNVVLNYILTPIMGIKGTAIATVVSFVLVFVIRAIGTQSFFPLDLDCKRMIPAIIIVTTQVVLFSFQLAGAFVQTLLFVGVLIIYWKKIAVVISKLYKLAKSKIKPTI